MHAPALPSPDASARPCQGSISPGRSLALLTHLCARCRRKGSEQDAARRSEANSTQGVQAPEEHERLYPLSSQPADRLGRLSTSGRGAAAAGRGPRGARGAGDALSPPGTPERRHRCVDAWRDRGGPGSSSGDRQYFRGRLPGFSRDRWMDQAEEPLAADWGLKGDEAEEEEAATWAQPLNANASVLAPSCEDSDASSLQSVSLTLRGYERAISLPAGSLTHL